MNICNDIRCILTLQVIKRGGNIVCCKSSSKQYSRHIAVLSIRHIHEQDATAEVFE